MTARSASLALAGLAATLVMSCGEGNDPLRRPSPATVTSVSPTPATPSTGPSVGGASAQSGGGAPPTPTGQATTAAGERLPDDPNGLATRLTALHATVTDPMAVDDDMAAAARSLQLAYRYVAARPALLAAVSGRLPAAVRETVVANVTARRELQALEPKRTEPPPWRVRTPAPAADLLAYYRQAESESGVPWSYLAAVHLVETHMGRIRSASTAGARGPMQFIPSTWAAYGRGDIDDDHDAILAAGRFLRDAGAPRAMAAALRRYNPSDHYVRAVTAYAGQITGDRAYLAYYHWQVLVTLVSGDVVLPEGYGA